MRATFLIACLAGLVGTVSAQFGGYTGGLLIPFEFLPTTGDNFTTFQTCAGDAEWPAAGGTFNISLGLEGCKTQCENAYTEVGEASFASYTITYGSNSMELGKCCCQAITTTQISAPSCIMDAIAYYFYDPSLSNVIQHSYLYKDYLPGSCEPWLTRCENSGTGGGWDQTCFNTNAVLTAAEYTQERPDDAIWGATEVVWGVIVDEGSNSCSATDSSDNVFNGTEGSCTAVIIPDWNDDGTPSPTLYAAGYCDSTVDSGTFAYFDTEAKCLAWAAADSYYYNYSWSNDAVFMWSGMESGSCAWSNGTSIKMTCGNWCSDSSGDDWCNALHSALVGAAKAFGTMLLVIIIVCVVVTCLGIIGCWYCCCRNKDQQVIVIQGQGQAGIPMATPMTQQQPPGAVYMKNGVWLDKNERPIPAQQV